MSEIFSWLKRAEVERRKGLVDITDEPVDVDFEEEAGASRATSSASLALSPPPPVEAFAAGNFDLSKASHKIRSVLDPHTLETSLADSQVLVNCTPVGMHPKMDESVVPAALLHKGLTVMDIVYNPLKTKLLAEAAARGLRTVSGVEMFVNQAVIQFELWTGRTAPREVMRNVVLDHLRAEAAKR